MEAQLNPFQPGAGLVPPELVGRDEHINAFDVLIQRARHRLLGRGMMLYGLRGVGKTVLLNRMHAMASRAGWTTIKIEGSLQEDSRKQLHLKLGSELTQAVLKLRNKTSNGVWQNLAEKVSSLSVTLGFAGASVALKIDMRQDIQGTGVMEFDLPDILLELAELQLEATSPAAVGIFIDEVQDLEDGFLDTLLTMQHEAGQKGLPLYLIGAGLPSVPARMGDIKTYAERLFTYTEIGALPEEATRRAFTDPFRRYSHGEFAEDALATMVEASQGYPYFVQQLGETLWDLADGPDITLEDSMNAVTLGRAALDGGFYRTRWERATQREKRYLVALAQLVEANGQAVPTSALAEPLQSVNISSFSKVRASLVKKGLLYSPAYGRIAFTVPGMDRFIKRAAQ